MEFVLTKKTDIGTKSKDRTVAKEYNPLNDRKIKSFIKN